MRHKIWKTWRCPTEQMDKKMNYLENVGWNIQAFQFIFDGREVVLMTFRYATSRKKGEREAGIT
jgi:hypothetical protein